MNLTEPHAGSDVGALTTKAVPNGDGSYAITGQKIFITWGDHDMTDNIIQLVLARLPDAPPGSKGISLFVAPKFFVNADGSLGERNTFKCIGLEHKMGIHASPTCVMEYTNAKGWLVGEENKGLAAMFTMMNSARLNVGLEGVAVGEGHALAELLVEELPQKLGGAGLEDEAQGGGVDGHGAEGGGLEDAGAGPAPPDAALTEVTGDGCDATARLVWRRGPPPAARGRADDAAALFTAGLDATAANAPARADMLVDLARVERQRGADSGRVAALVHAAQAQYRDRGLLDQVSALDEFLAGSPAQAKRDE